MNRRVVRTRGGLPADVLTLIEEPEPAAPERGQVLIRTTAFPVHPGDLLAIEAHPADGCVPGDCRPLTPRVTDRNRRSGALPVD